MGNHGTGSGERSERQEQRQGCNNGQSAAKLLQPLSKAMEKVQRLDGDGLHMKAPASLMQLKIKSGHMGDHVESPFDGDERLDLVSNRRPLYRMMVNSL